MEKIDHVAIAVKSFAASVPAFEKLLGTPCLKYEAVESQQVNTAFFKAGDTKIELLESTTMDGVIAKFIEKKGEGIHHIALQVTDMQAEISRLKNAGFTFLSEKPTPGADNKMVCFLHPGSTNGVLVEICADRVLEENSTDQIH